MLQVTIVCVGTLKETFWQAALAEYEKRLSAFCRLTVEELREEKIPDENDPAAIRRALTAEGEKILARIPEGTPTVALCIEGKTFPSPELAAELGRMGDRSGKLAFVIGSSHGLSEAVKARADLRLSLSPLTFPHQMTRVLLAEVLYRSFAIGAGRNYHK